MGNDEYFASHTAEASERERLGLIERLFDPLSQRRLAGLGIRQGWHCLEVGAGHGSLARWLAGQVGPQGRVVATDINPRFLAEIELPNMEVRQHDIRTDPLETGAHDLAHCRALLQNLAEPNLALRIMAAALRIGGWLLVEEGDASSSRAVDAEHALAGSFNQKTREIFERVAHSSSANINFGGRVRGLLEEAGLTDVGNEGVALIARGGELDARRMCMSFQVWLERGLISQAGALNSKMPTPSELQLHHSDGVCCVGEARQLTNHLTDRTTVTLGGSHGRRATEYASDRVGDDARLSSVFG